MKKRVRRKRSGEDGDERRVTSDVSSSAIAGSNDFDFFAAKRAGFASVRI